MGRLSCLRILLVFSLLSAGLFLSAQQPTSVDWPMYHLNPQHSGFNGRESTINAGNAKFLEEKWEGLLKGPVDFSSPAIVGGTAFLGSTDGNLYAFNASGCGQEFCLPVWIGPTGGEIYYRLRWQTASCMWGPTITICSLFARQAAGKRHADPCG